MYIPGHSFINARPYTVHVSTHDSQTDSDHFDCITFVELLA